MSALPPQDYEPSAWHYLIVGAVLVAGGLILVAIVNGGY